MKHSWLPIAGLSLALAVPAWADLSPQDFVDRASAAGVAEIETARLALEQGTSAEVKNFAEQMIKDHTAANEDLKEIASRKSLELSDSPDAMNKVLAAGDFLEVLVGRGVVLDHLFGEILHLR